VRASRFSSNAPIDASAQPGSAGLQSNPPSLNCTQPVAEIPLTERNWQMSARFPLARPGIAIVRTQLSTGSNGLRSHVKETLRRGLQLPRIVGAMLCPRVQHPVPLQDRQFAGSPKIE
jgi:hypothetical protein